MDADDLVPHGARVSVGKVFTKDWFYKTLPTVIQRWCIWLKMPELYNHKFYTCTNSSDVTEIQNLDLSWTLE